ncbi:hypothetical protein [Mycolicibacterium sp. XJ870]
MSNTLDGIIGDIYGLDGQGPELRHSTSLWPGIGDPDLAVTTEALVYFTAAFDKYRAAFDQQRTAIKGFASLPEVLTYTSAVETNKQLSQFARENVITTLDAYISYLDEFKATVDTAIRRILAET